MINVLFIDTDESVLHLCKKYFERSSDFKVGAVQSVRDAEKLLSKEKYDAIVSEMYLPWMSGLEFLKRLRVKGDPMPYILFTGRVQEDVIIDAINSGVDHFLLKGANPQAKFSDLEQMIRQAVHDRWKQDSTNLKTVAFDKGLTANLIVDAQGRLLEFNEAAMKLWHVTTRDDLVGTDIKNMVEFQEILEVIKAAIDILGRWEGDLTAKRTDGSVFTAYALVTGINDVTGKLTSYQVSVSDITNKKNDVEAMKKNDENLRIIDDNSTDWVLMLDASGSIVYSSGAIQEMSGFGVEEVLKMCMDDLVHQEDRSALKDALWSIHLNDRAAPLEFRLMRKDGTSLPVEMIGRTVKDKDGLVTRTLVICRDISHRTKAVEAPAAAKAPEQVANVNVIASSEDLDRLLDVKGYLEVVRERAKDPWILDRYALMDSLLDTVIENAMAIMELQQIGTKEAEWWSVHDLIKDVITRVDPEDVHVQVLANRLEILADPMLDRVFFELIDNTVKHGDDAHRIWITYELEGDRARIIFEDDGVGIPREMKPELFDKRDGRHGLSIASAILQATDITIAENGVPGKGVRFEILVPQDRFRLKEWNRPN